MGSPNDPLNRNVLGTPEYYRAQAEFCRRQAEQAADEAGIRQKYLDLAEKWEGLARAVETD